MIRHARRRLWSGLLLSFALGACQPPEADASATVRGNDDGIVVEALGDGSDFTWGATLTIAAAEAGEWLLFASPNRPTSLAGVTTFDPDRDCGPSVPDCGIAAVGSYVARATLDAKGRLEIQSRTLGSPESRDQYYVLARRGGAPPAFVAVDVKVGVAGGGGCFGMPDAPDVHALDVPR